VENQSLLYCYWNEKWYNHHGKEVGSSPKLNIGLAHDSSIPILGIYCKLKADIQTNICAGLCNHQSHKVEITKLSISG
jgi:hypothetical protein